MRLFISCASLSLLVAAPAFATADSFNSMNMQVNTGNFDAGWSYAFKSRDNATSVLAQLRAVCKSSDRYDQRRCAKGTAILENAYAELQARRAAEGVIAD